MLLLSQLSRLSCNNLLKTTYSSSQHLLYTIRKTNRGVFSDRRICRVQMRGSYQESNWCQILKEYPCSLINSHITIWRSWSYKKHMNDVDPTTVKVIAGRWPCTLRFPTNTPLFLWRNHRFLQVGKHTPTTVSRRRQRSVNDSFDTFLLFGRY